MNRPALTAFDWMPDFAKGQVRDLRVRWALEEVGQDYAVRHLSQGDQKAPPHRACQPFGQVPTYQSGDLGLFESDAIVLHIAGTDCGLSPEDPDARARAIEWMFAALNTVEPPIVDQAIATLFEADKPWSQLRLPAVIARFDDRLRDLSTRLGTRAWLDRDRFTAGDLLMAAVLPIQRGDNVIAGYANLSDYLARAEARPAFPRALAAQLAGFSGTPPPEFPGWRDNQNNVEGGCP